MTDLGSGARRWIPLLASAAIAIALVGTAGLINGWILGALLLLAWALLTYGVRSFVSKSSRAMLVSVTGLILVFVLWDYTASQPRIRVDAVQLRKVPSSVVPGLVELTLRNTGSTDADLVVVSAGYLGPLFSNAQQLVAANVEAELTQRLKQASPTPSTGTIALIKNQSIAVNVDVPFSERAWVFGRGETTLLVAARIQYRDRVFRRETTFCQFLNPRSATWVSCPFLNN